MKKNLVDIKNGKEKQGKRDHADADMDTADQSNTYMSPFQATQKLLQTVGAFEGDAFKAFS